ncbi:MAG: DUF1311 domain-containing protein [Proteobacteria bacterium]|nr:DUF1311 domain-containing protein [Pseudomonadota bacterium]
MASVASAEEDPLLEPPYGATEAEIEEALLDCQHNEIANNICAWRAFMDSGQALDKSYAALASVENVDVESLKKAQLAFISFRNAACDFDMKNMDGSMGWGVAYRCRLSYNERRTAALNAYLSCLGQDCELPVLLYTFDR